MFRSSSESNLPGYKSEPLWLGWLLVLLLIPVSAFGSGALSPDNSSSTRRRVGEQVALGAVNTLLAFDHAFTKSSTAVSRSYLQRMAGPGSRYYSDYVRYKQGRLSRSDLVARLPHVAMIGDSLSKNAYISSIPSTFWRARTERRRDWFLDTDPSSRSVYSVFERIETLTPLVATEYSGVGAVVDAGEKENFVRSLVRTRNFSGQVREILQAKTYPDLVMIWIGHNNLDWAAATPLGEREHPEKRLEKYAKQFRINYTRQMRRLLSSAQGQNHKVAIIVFGLVNFDAFFKARASAEALRAKNPQLYPYLEIDYRHYLSMKPAYRGNMIKLALMMNRELAAMTTELNHEFGHSPNLRLRYSDALAKVDISAVELIHQSDAWHPSAKGHTLIAQAAFDALSPSLEFIGIKDGATPLKRP